jgi:MFS family permease
MKAKGEALKTGPADAAMPDGQRRPRVLSAFRSRDFALLWSGAFLSNTGTWIQTTVLLWFVFQFTNSNAWVGAVNFAGYMPILLFVIVSGALADYLNRKLLIMVTQSVMGVAALGLAISAQLGIAHLPEIFLFTLLSGIAFVFNFPAWRAIVPDLVPRRDMLNGIALDAAQYNMARFVGPVLGTAVLHFWTVQAAFYVNAASFLAVIVALLVIRTRTPPIPRKSASNREHVYEGIRYVWGTKWSRDLLSALAVFSFFGLSFIVALPGFSEEVLNRGSGGYGMLLAFMGLGAVMGAPFVTFLRGYVVERDIIRYCILAFGLLLLLFSLFKVLWISLLLSMGLGSTSLMTAATVNTVLQSKVGRDMRGRIMSFYILVFQGLFPVGGLVLGYISDIWSVAFALRLYSLVCLGLALVLIVIRSLLREAVSPDFNTDAQVHLFTARQSGPDS